MNADDIKLPKYQALPDGKKSIAVITCSTRPSRIGHFVTQHVISLLDSKLSTHGNQSLTTSSIDLLSHQLPLDDEPGIPSFFPASNPTPHYAHEHTRAWSAEILKHAAFIFITPQYNWGYTASFKNAVDHLFHEWGGKPALVVSYGARGGPRAGRQLLEVCKGLRMKTLEKTVGYQIKLDEGPSTLENGGFSEERKEAWRAQGTDKELDDRFEELVGLLL
jgi:NAD(P)H-dependent FMN reductase